MTKYDNIPGHIWLLALAKYAINSELNELEDLRNFNDVLFLGNSPYLATGKKPALDPFRSKCRYIEKWTRTKGLSEDGRNTSWGGREGILGFLGGRKKGEKKWEKKKKKTWDYWSFLPHSQHS